MGDKPGRNCNIYMWTIIVLDGIAAHFFLKNLRCMICLAKYVWNSKNTPLLAISNMQRLLIIVSGIYLDGYVQPSKVNFKDQCVLKEEGCQSFLKANHIIDGHGLPDSSKYMVHIFAWALLHLSH